MNSTDASPGMGNSRATPDDKALMGDYCSNRSEGVFQQIVRRHGAMVFRTCRRLLGNDHDAEDAAQAVFLLLAQRPNAVRSCLAAWLHQVAWNVASKIVRARRRRVQYEKKAAQMRPTASAPDDNTPLREELDAALAQLPASVREVVLLRYLEGRSQEEAARIIGCPQGTLAWRAKQGLDQLRAVLQRRGVVVTTSVLLSVMAQEARAGLLVMSLVPLKLAATHLGATNDTVAVLADSVWQSLVWGKVHKAALLTLALLAAGSVPAVGYWVHARAFRPAGVVQQETTPPLPVLDGPVVEALAGPEIDEPFGSIPESVVFSPDGRMVVAGRSNGAIKMWNKATRQLERSLTGHAGRVSCVAFSSSGRLLASGGFDAAVRLWDPASGACLHTLTGHTGKVGGVAFAPYGATLASTSWDGFIKLWETSTGRCLATLSDGVQPGVRCAVWTAVFAPDGRHLVTGESRGRVRVWDLAARRPYTTLLEDPKAAVMKLAVSPDGQALAVPVYETGVYLFEIATWKQRDLIPFHVATAVAFAPDGKTLAITGIPDAPLAAPGMKHWATVLWDLKKRRERGRFQQETEGGSSVVYAPDGQALVVGNHGTVTLLNPSALTPAPLNQRR